MAGAVAAEGVRELAAVVAAIEAGVAALRQNECSHEHGCSRSSRQLLARASPSSLAAPAAAPAAPAALPQELCPILCNALPHRRTAELPQPPVLCCPAVLPVPLTLAPVWLPVRGCDPQGGCP